MSNSDEKKVVSLSDRQKDKQIEDLLEEGSGLEPVYCSFCGRPNTMVIKMIQGPGVNICSECTMIAVQYLILEDKIPSNEARKILDALWSGSKK